LKQIRGSLRRRHVFTPPGMTSLAASSSAAEAVIRPPKESQ
jgi:hypothetical protein